MSFLLKYCMILLCVYDVHVCVYDVLKNCDLGHMKLVKMHHSGYQLGDPDNAHLL